MISGDTALTKAGSGQLTTSANNTYTGGTTVSAGTLFGGAGRVRTNDVLEQDQFQLQAVQRFGLIEVMMVL